MEGALKASNVPPRQHTVTVFTAGCKCDLIKSDTLLWPMFIFYFTTSDPWFVLSLIKEKVCYYVTLSHIHLCPLDLCSDWPSVGKPAMPSEPFAYQPYCAGAVFRGEQHPPKHQDGRMLQGIPECCAVSCRHTVGSWRHQLLGVSQGHVSW